MPTNSQVNVSYERFVVGYLVFYTVYAVLLVLLIGYYTPREPWIYAFLCIVSLTALAIVVDHLAPNFVKATERAPVFLAVKPFISALTAVHLIGLGMVTNDYSKKNVLYNWVFVVMCIMNTALFAGIGMIRVDINSAPDATKTGTRFAFNLPILDRLTDNLYAQRKRMQFEEDM